MLGVDPRPYTYWQLMRMADGKLQHDWDLFSFVSFWTSAPYQKKGFSIFDIHPGYDKKTRKPSKAKMKRNIERYKKDIGAE